MAETTDYANIDEAMKVARKYMSPRYLSLQNLEAWYDGEQYAGMPNWFDDGENAKPLHERAPCVVYTVAKSAAQSNVDLCLGTGRFPVTTTNPGEDDSDWDVPEDEKEEAAAPPPAAKDKKAKLMPLPQSVQVKQKVQTKAQKKKSQGEGLDEGESRFFDRFVQEVQRRSRYVAVARDALTQAQRCGTTCTTLRVHKGIPKMENLPAKWCTPSFGTDGEVVFLTIMYPYLQPYRDPRDLTWKVKVMLFKRTIGLNTDVTYKPAEANDNGIEPEWVVDPNKTIVHNFGFCPVVWYRFGVACEVAGQDDGFALHEEILDEMHALNFAYSIKHMAAITCGDPQLVEIGVMGGFNPGAPGKTPTLPATKKGGTAGPGNPMTGRYAQGKPTRARRRGSRSPWQYPNKDTKVQQLTLPGDALKAVDEHCQDLRGKIAEALSVVFMDTSTVKFATALSGKALQILRERQVSACDTIREEFEAGWLEPINRMLLRIIYRCCELQTPGCMRVRGVDQAYTLMGRVQPVASELPPAAGQPEGEPAQPAGGAVGTLATTEWEPPPLFTQWPGYFRPDVEDQQKKITAAGLAKEKGVATVRDIAAFLSDVFPHENLDQAAQALSEEAVTIDVLTKLMTAHVPSETYARELLWRVVCRVMGGASPEVLEEIKAQLLAAPAEDMIPPSPKEQFEATQVDPDEDEGDAPSKKKESDE